MRWIIFGGIALIVYSIIVAPKQEIQTVQTSQAAPTDPVRDLKTRGCIAAIYTIRNHLKQPNTSGFPDCFRGLDKYDIQVDLRKRKMVVYGEVLARNQFGGFTPLGYQVYFTINEAGTDLAKIHDYKYWRIN